MVNLSGGCKCVCVVATVVWRKAHGFCSSQVEGERWCLQPCIKYAVYWQSELGLIELLTDITSAAAQNNKSFAPTENKQKSKPEKNVLNNRHVM